ncbi:MAG TPA: hypothetical protein VIK72_12865 [Clostridiaceae bacterium]
MNRKKIFATLLSLSLVVFLFTGCGSDKTGVKGSASKKGQTNFSLFFNLDTKPVDISNTAVGKIITKITGTTFKTDYLVGTDSKTKSGVMIASGEYPDLISLDAGDVDTFINAGAVIPLEDYIEKYGTNIKKAYGNDLKKLKNLKDGHTYSLPPFRTGPTPLYPGSGFYLAKDVLKQAGYPAVKTLDQYFKLIEDYMVKNPTYNGKPNIGFTTNAVKENYLIANVGSYLAGYPNTGACYVDDKNVAHNFGLSDFTHNYIQKLNVEWGKNIIDKQLFIDNNDAFKAKVAAGRVLGMYMGRWEIQDAITSLEQQKAFDRVPFALPILFDGVAKDAYSGLISIGTGGGIYITKSCKDPVAAFKMLDKMASDDIQKLNNWGIEGVDYTVKDGKMIQTAAQSAKLADPTYPQKTGVGGIWFFPHSDAGADAKYADGNFVNPQDTPEYIAAKYQPYEKEVMDAYKVTNLNDMFAPAVKSDFGYGWDISIPDSEPVVKVAQQKTNDLQQKYMASLVMAKPSTFESVWSQYSKDMKGINYNVGDDYITKQIQGRVKNWK